MSTFSKTVSKAVERLDGWMNVLTGIGAGQRDKRMSAVAVVDVLCREDCETIWEGSDMGARIVETVPNEMLREGFEVKVQVDDDSDADTAKETSEMIAARCEALDIEGSFKTALQYERAYGGSAILLGANDGQRDLRRPLNEDAVSSLDWLTVLEKDELYPTDWYSDPQAPKFGQARLYRLQPFDAVGMNSYTEVHESRLIKFGGIVTSRRRARINQGWGSSVFVRCNRVLADFDQTWGAASILCQDFAQAVLKIEGLAELISTNNDDVVIKRAQLMDMQRSTARMLLLDSTESFERQASPMTGMPDMLQQFVTRLAAAADMPVTLLFGQSPGGLNATGASDVRFFYDRVRARQRTHLRPKLCRFIELLLKSKTGPTAGQVPDNWSIAFNPLWQLDETEKADVRLKQAQADQIYIMTQVATPEEIGASRFGGDAYSTETVIDFDSRAEMSKVRSPTNPAELRKPFGGGYGTA